MTAPRPENLSKPLDIAAIEPYLAIWANTIGSVLGQVAAPFGGKTLAVDWKKLPAPDSAAATSEPASVGPGSIEPAGMIFLNTTLAGTLRGEQAFGLSLPLARWLAQTFMGEPVTEPPEGTNGIAAAKMPSGTPPELSVDHRDKPALRGHENELPAFHSFKLTNLTCKRNLPARRKANCNPVC